MRTDKIKKYVSTLKDIRFKYDEVFSEEEKIAVGKVYNFLKVQMMVEETKRKEREAK